MKAWDEFKLIFRNPRKIHRVLAVIPLAALLSHAIYLNEIMPKGVPIGRDYIITLVLGSILYFMTIAWVLLSNESDIELTMRFIWCAALSILGHRIAVMSGEVGGSWYFKVVAFFAIGTLLLFVITGKTKNELKIWFNVKLNEKRNNPPAQIHAVTNRYDSDRKTLIS